MKLVIDIPDDIFDWYDNGFPEEDDAEKLWQIVKNGTPLPKTHGRLIDADEFEKRLINAGKFYTTPITADGFDKRFGDGLFEAARKLNEASTVLEATEEQE